MVLSVLGLSEQEKDAYLLKKIKAAQKNKTRTQNKLKENILG
jgi:hypothetical protein